jgi:hypothetical protein
MDETYRKELIVKLDIPYYSDISYVPVNGGGSSFIGRQRETDPKSYNQRYKNVEFSPEYIKLLADDELIKLSHELFPEVNIRSWLINYSQAHATCSSMASSSSVSSSITNFSSVSSSFASSSSVDSSSSVSSSSSSLVDSSVDGSVDSSVDSSTSNSITRPSSFIGSSSISQVRPIQLSISGSKVVSNVHSKYLDFSYVISGDQSIYVYKDEQSYCKQYQRSYFALTKRQGGWDCLHHYEILANGCIPYFENLNQCPKSIMTLFPKDLIWKAMNIPGVRYPHIDRFIFDKAEYYRIADELLSLGLYINVGSKIQR